MQNMEKFSKRVLIVDDDRSVVRMLQLVLQQAGFQVLTAFDGHEGLRKAWEERPDLIILDIVMPEIDGYRVCRALQSKPETENIPVLMLTVKGQVDSTKEQNSILVSRRIQERLAGYDAGATEFLSKPLKAAEVVAQVKKILGLTTVAGKAKA